jgi:hypothetical protein
MSVRVRDLEIALVLAREMKAAAARSVDASLRLDQLQEVFGVERLDQAERARIQTALQMAGLEPFPSLLQADPTEPIRFGAAQAAVTAERAVPDEPAVEPAAASEAPPATFPTVGEFARSKLRGRRFGLRRGDHSDNDAVPPPPPPPLAEDSNGRLPEEPPWEEPEPEAEAPDEAATAIHAIPQDEAEVEAEPEVEDAARLDEPEVEVEEPHDEPVEDAAGLDEPEPEEPHDEPEDVEPDPVAEVPGDAATAIHAIPEDEPEVEAEVEDHPAPAPAEDEREYIPLVPEQPAAYEPRPPEPEPEPVGARAEEVAAVLLPAVAIPVIVTSIAGWRFGLPFVALSVIATGWLLSRHGGISRAWRRSPAAGTVLKTTAAVTVLSAVAAIVLASVGKDDSTKSHNTASPPAKKPAEPSTASKPATTTPATAPAKKPHKKKPAASHPSPSTPSEPSKPSSEPPPDPATQGLIRVPPSQAAQTPTTPSTTPPGTQTTP